MPQTEQNPEDQLNAHTFFERFKARMMDLNKEMKIIGKNDDVTKIKDPFDDITLYDPEFTLMVSIATYNVVKTMNGLFLKIEIPPTRYKKGMIDYTILNSENERLIDIEHENRPNRRDDNEGYAFEKSLRNLTLSDAKYKILISYSFGKKCSDEKLRKRCAQYLKKMKNQKIFLIIADAELLKPDSYRIFEISSSQYK